MSKSNPIKPPGIMSHLIFAVLCLYLLLDRLLPVWKDQEQLGGYGFITFFTLALLYNLYRIVQKRRLYQQQLQRHNTEQQRQIEKQILAIAARFNGRISPEEISMHSDLSLAQAKAQLDQMVQNNLAQQLITEKGVIIYAFAGLMHPDDKAGAKSAMDL